MGLWAKSVRIFTYLCDHGTQSVRRVARQTGLSKSSVHRLTQAMQRRDHHPASWLWETAEGRQWLTRLVIATLYTFGLKRGGGLETISAFFVRLPLATQVGCSASALRGVMQTLEAARLETARAWESAGPAHAAVHEIIGAVAATFVERMLLVCMDLRTGSLRLAEVADDRTYATWKAVVEERLKALGAHVLYVVSDRAKALVQLADTGLECLSRPDCFHVVHDSVQSYSLPIGQRVRHARQERTKAHEALARRQGQRQATQEGSEAKALGAARQADVVRWEEAHPTSRGH